MNQPVSILIDHNVFSGNKLWATAVAFVSFLILPVLVYSILDHAPEYDELLHILAARGLNAEGVPAIADGLYTRAGLYTQLVAWVTSVGGDELLIGRLPAVFFAMVLSAVLGFWGTRRAGGLAGLATVFVFVVAPMTISAAVMVRFYTAHTLVVTLMLLIWFDLVASRSLSWLARLCLLIVSVILLWLGLQLHELTKISIVSGLAGLAMLGLYELRKPMLGIWLARPAITSVILFCLLSALMVAAWWLNVIELLRGTLPLWSVDKANNPTYYISSLSVHLPFVWPLFSLLAVLALIDKTRLVLFCLVVFTCALLINSLAAQKATRYFYHALPMLCIVWGIGLQRLVVFVSSLIQQRVGWRHAYSVMLIAAVVAVCLLSTHEVKRALKLALGRDIQDESLPVINEPDWLLARKDIEPMLPLADTIIVTSAVKGLFAFGRYDYELSATVVQETETGLEFGIDPRTGRAVISQPDSVLQVINEPGKELFVLENRMVNQFYSAPVESINVLNSQCKVIDIEDQASQLSAWLC